MQEMKAIDLLRQTIQLGEHLLATADEDDYASWNDVVLRTLRVLFGPSSEQFLSFRFPGGGQAGGTVQNGAHQDIGMNLMKRVAEDLQEYGTVELQPKPEGRQITMVLTPTKKRR